MFQQHMLISSEGFQNNLTRIGLEVTVFPTTRESLSSPTIQERYIHFEDIIAETCKSLQIRFQGPFHFTSLMIQRVFHPVQVSDDM